MDEKPDQIVEHIEAQRNRLGRNLQELENRVRSTTDWRQQFDRHPFMFLGLAAGGGLLLGSLTGGSKKKSYRSGSNYYSSPKYTGAAASSSALMSSSSSATSVQKQRAAEMLDGVRGALIGWASTQLKQFLVDSIPNFQQHLDEAQQKNTMHSGSSAYGSNEASGLGSTPYGSGSSYGTGSGASNMGMGSGLGSTGTTGSSTGSGSGLGSTGTGSTGTTGSTGSTGKKPHESTTHEPTPTI